MEDVRSLISWPARNNCLLVCVPERTGCRYLLLALLAKCISLYGDVRNSYKCHNNISIGSKGLLHVQSVNALQTQRSGSHNWLIIKIPH
jgi:hypothetical protein